MEAVVVDKPGPIESHPLAFKTVPDPRTGPGDVLIEVEACGVCRTDLHVTEGDLPYAKPDLIPGHEVVGRVKRAGSKASRFKPGDRVGLPWLYSTCGKCEFCLRGDENLCPSSAYTGYTRDGGYAELVVGREEFLLPVPDDIPAQEFAPLLCSGIIGYRAFKMANLPPSGRLALIGFGGSAHMVLQLAKKLGHKTVVVSRTRSHLDLARRLGASEVYALGSDKDVKLLKSKPVDSAIVFAPKGSLVLTALSVLKRGGTAVVASIHSDDIPPLNYEAHLFHEKKLMSVEANTRADAKEFLSLARRLRLRGNISTLRLERAEEALAQLKKGGVNGALVLIP